MAGEQEPGREQAFEYQALKTAVDALMTGAKSASPDQLRTMQEAIKKLTPIVESSATKSTAQLARTPESARSAEEAIGRLRETYNQMRSGTGEEQLSRLRSELGPDAEVECRSDVIYLRVNKTSEWKIVPDLGKKFVPTGLKRWFNIPPHHDEESGPRKVSDFRLEELASFPNEDVPWDKASGDWAMHKKLGRLVWDPKRR